MTRARWRLDLVWHRRPRLSEAVLAIVGVPSLCLAGAGASFYLGDDISGITMLLRTTMPLAVLAAIIGTRRRQLVAALDPREILALRAVLSPGDWQTVGREAHKKAADWLSLKRTATLGDVLYWLDGPKRSADYDLRRRAIGAQLEAFDR